MVSSELAVAANDALRWQQNWNTLDFSSAAPYEEGSGTGNSVGRIRRKAVNSDYTPRETSSPATLHERRAVELSPLLVQTASAARWRRREDKSSNNNVDKYRGRSNSELVLQVKMEDVHGVDVSWLHHTNKDHHRHKYAQSSPDVRRDVKAPIPTSKDTERKPGVPENGLTKLPSPPNVTPPKTAQPAKDNTNAVPSTPTPSATNKPLPKRPSLLSRASNERMSQDGGKPGVKRSSWMNSLSSKFSNGQERPGPTPTQQPRSVSAGAPPTASGNTTPGSEAAEEAEPYTPAKPKESSSSFFSSITRRLSSGSQAGGIPKAQGAGTLCPRKVLNVDPNRQRCLVPEMDPNKLRRVSFCVDVEIAGGPRYVDDDEDDEERMRKKKEFKMKERAEGEALKRPDTLAEEKDEEGEPKLESKSKARAIPGKAQPGKEQNGGSNGSSGSSVPQTEEERESAARKREKKQKSEAERKERKEKRRKRAEENGQIPVELSLDGGSDDVASPGLPNGSSTSLPQTPVQPQPNSAKQDRPTTDPARIYRRCCQLRESPILKRITEQLSRPNCILPQEPGVVQCLDLTGSRLQLADVISLGDWLAVVPVKHLKLEDADLSDEGVRCILAGLLAAKRPEPTKRRSLTPKHREGLPFKPHQERAGIVEKITLKNNPRLTKSGWKHISLFLYMCRSLKTIDVSMNQFPDTLPPSAQVTPMKSPTSAPPQNPAQELDAAECLYKCLCERLGGTRLEELIMSECGLTAPQIRKVVDGAIAADVSRLGLAGNHIDDEGLEHVLHYLRSGVCQALDIGGNDLRGKLSIVAEAINTHNEHPCWGLSLASCNLDAASLKPLFAVLQKLPNFRFIDLSHNRDLCSDNGLISILRRYIGQMKDLKRVHLADVGMSPKQAIALADVLPEGPRLAHLSLLQNPQLTALANARTEADQEEACALYASLMASVRVSSTIICIDIDVPAPENSEIVKALAKQIVAYSLRNMERFAIAEFTGDSAGTANAASALTQPHGGEQAIKEIGVPDVLFHLVGHVDGNHENHDEDPPAPDEDYIIGGAGVVKALQYVLGEKENDGRRSSTTPSGTLTPRDRPGSSAGLVDQGKAKKMSKNLLDSARKIRARLQPALAKEAASGDDLAYRRLQGLDDTVQKMIARFEEEFPETRIPAPSQLNTSETSSLTDQSALLASSINTQATDLTNVSDEEDPDLEIRPHTISRHNSEVNLASRQLGIEEGRLHRIGQQLRREVIDSPRSAEGGADFAPWREDERLQKLREKIESVPGVELGRIVEKEGWDGLLQKIGGNYEDLRKLQEQDPEGWAVFKDAQEKARLNVNMQG